MVMNRLLQFGLLGIVAGALAGCPVWDDDDDHDGWEDGSSCFGEGCNPGPECTNSDQCGVNATCGEDNECHPGDCTFWGCASGECTVGEDGTASCTGGSGSGGSGAGGSGSGAGGSGATGGGPDVVYCGNPDDCAAGETCGPEGICEPGSCDTVGCIYGYSCDTTAAPPVCKPTNPAACGSDGDCAEAGAGYACVSGICTAPDDQCFDQGQCAPGSKCAGGKCVPGCDADAECDGGFECNEAQGVCSEPGKECTITNDCGGPVTVCVDGTCVPRSDGATCPAGTVWVENGCIPDQSATFTCAVDGQQDACNAGSICLHHSCYINCASPNETACANLPNLNVCKSVTTSSGMHQVCGSNENLGNECDPQAGQACSVGICIDGFCK
jgi:hypothetical protein